MKKKNDQNLIEEIKSRLIRVYQEGTPEKFLSQFHMFEIDVANEVAKTISKNILSFCGDLIEIQGDDPIIVYVSLTSAIRSGKIKMHKDFEFGDVTQFVEQLRKCKN